MVTRKKRGAAGPGKAKSTTAATQRSGAQEEAQFWALLEVAWASQGARVNAQRRALARRAPDDEAQTDLVDEALDAVVEQVRAAMAAMPKAELIAMDRVVERKLYELDRQEVQEVTDGSDDGFLYARGYIVALGQAFYEAVNEDPSLAIPDAECEELCYLPMHVFEDRFEGEVLQTGSNISRESGSNRQGWADD